MITKIQYMAEMALNIIKQEYIDINNVFPIPSSDIWVYKEIINIIDCLIEQERK